MINQEICTSHFKVKRRVHTKKVKPHARQLHAHNNLMFSLNYLFQLFARPTSTCTITLPRVNKGYITMDLLMNFWPKKHTGQLLVKIIIASELPTVHHFFDLQRLSRKEI